MFDSAYCGELNDDGQPHSDAWGKIWGSDSILDVKPTCGQKAISDSQMGALNLFNTEPKYLRSVKRMWSFLENNNKFNLMTAAWTRGNVTVWPINPHIVILC